MAQASPDRECVGRLQQRFSRHLKEGHEWGCQYNAEGGLISLNLSDLGLSQVPSEIWKLTSLRELDLRGNQLTHLPAELGQLTCLQKLSLQRNRLTCLPAELGQLTNLQKLYLDDNYLERLPVEIGQLACLQMLYIGNNRLTQLPGELGRLARLQWLELGDNRLTRLPAELGQLARLQWLHLFNNQLTQLPAELSQLPNLQMISVNGNPDLHIPPPETVARGPRAMLAYLRGLLTTVERSEAKLIVVGEGGMGKSSLLRAWQQQPFDPSLSPTHGIAVGTMQVPHPTKKGNTITLHTWDFGGQEIYQATLQFFLTRRSVYLVVWNARLGPEPCRLSFWLETIRTLAPDARIILVATHGDQWQPSLDLAAYQKRYPQITGQCAISNKDGRGLDTLRELIATAAAGISLVGEQWPKSWVEAEQQLLSRPEHSIDFHTFLALPHLPCCG